MKLPWRKKHHGGYCGVFPEYPAAVLRRLSPSATAMAEAAAEQYCKLRIAPPAIESQVPLVTRVTAGDGGAWLCGVCV